MRRIRFVRLAIAVVIIAFVVVAAIGFLEVTTCVFGCSVP